MQLDLEAKLLHFFNLNNTILSFQFSCMEYKKNCDVEFKLKRVSVLEGVWSKQYMLNW